MRAAARPRSRSEATLVDRWRALALLSAGSVSASAVLPTPLWVLMRQETLVFVWPHLLAGFSAVLALSTLVASHGPFERRRRLVIAATCLVALLTLLTTWQTNWFGGCPAAGCRAVEYVPHLRAVLVLAACGFAFASIANARRVS